MGGGGLRHSQQIKNWFFFISIREDHSQPHLHTATMVGYRGQLLIAVLGPVLATLRRILGRLIVYTVLVCWFHRSQLLIAVLGPVLATLRCIGTLIVHTAVFLETIVALSRCKCFGSVFRGLLDPDPGS